MMGDQGMASVYFPSFAFLSSQDLFNDFNVGLLLVTGVVHDSIIKIVYAPIVQYVPFRSRVTDPLNVQL